MKLIKKILLAAALVLGFVSCDNASNPESGDENTSSSNAAIVASYNSGTMTYNFRSDSTFSIHYYSQETDADGFTVIYDYDQAEGTYTGNPNQDGDISITIRTAVSNAGSSPSTSIAPISSRTAATNSVVQEKIARAKEAGESYVVITNDDIPLVSAEENLSLTISDNSITTDEGTFTKVRTIATYVCDEYCYETSREIYTLIFRNDNTFTFHTYREESLDGNQFYTSFDIDDFAGTYTGNPLANGTIVLTKTKGAAATRGVPTDPWEKWTSEMNAGNLSYVVTNTDYPLTPCAPQTANATINNNILVYNRTDFQKR